MMLYLRRRRAAARLARKNELSNDDSGDNLEMQTLIPAHFRCPISLDLMKDPVILSTGITYDRESIEKWIEDGNQTCPVTNQVLLSFDQIPNHFIRKMIQDWCVENTSYGIQRIPTPRIPVTPYEVSETCKRIVAATQRKDHMKCKELVVKVENWGKESQRNKRCIVDNGTGSVLAATFESFAEAISTSSTVEKYTDLLVKILSVLVWMFPLSGEGQLKLGSVNSLRCMVWLLKSNGDLSARQNAALVLKELLYLDQKHVNTLGEMGIIQALMELIKEPICHTSMKASLMAICYMISPSTISDNISSEIVELGAVSLIIEILVDGDKSICEKALGVLDHICESKEGREKVADNALTIPLLFRKILASELTSKFSVSILWKLCKDEKSEEEGGVVAEALQLKVGAFQKLLILLQIGCDKSTKEKVTELLKLFNISRAKLDCIDSSMDFRYLEKSY
ncbi:U-box domain-containing protein 21 [Manihot esculenta]|uniref:U-box domain-containing protein n=1 Tax=Manihot esculenta TaxID=3983 RepID=A0A2C9WC06_MANES|nr:U-box domain-containing protein 21 [Manihot esculenta]OAY57211.1 hypothetical protein MANES_02G079100v8 [Manihot esculenta]